MLNPAGCKADQLKNILSFCRFDCIDLSNGKKLFYTQIKNKYPINKEISKKNIKLNIRDKKNKKIIKKQIKKDPNSPFAVLEKLL